MVIGGGVTKHLGTTWPLGVVKWYWGVLHTKGLHTVMQVHTHRRRQRWDQAANCHLHILRLAPALLFRLQLKGYHVRDVGTCPFWPSFLRPVLSNWKSHAFQMRFSKPSSLAAGLSSQSKPYVRFSQPSSLAAGLFPQLKPYCSWSQDAKWGTGKAKVAWEFVRWHLVLRVAAADELRLPALLCFFFLTFFVMRRQRGSCSRSR